MNRFRWWTALVVPWHDNLRGWRHNFKTVDTSTSMHQWFTNLLLPCEAMSLETAIQLTPNTRGFPAQCWGVQSYWLRTLWKSAKLCAVDALSNLQSTCQVPTSLLAIRLSKVSSWGKKQRNIRVVVPSQIIADLDHLGRQVTGSEIPQRHATWSGSTWMTPFSVLLSPLNYTRLHHIKHCEIIYRSCQTSFQP